MEKLLEIKNLKKYFTIKGEKAGRNKLVLTSTNDHGVWALDFRITGEDGVPLPGVRFRLE